MRRANAYVLIGSIACAALFAACSDDPISSDNGDAAPPTDVAIDAGSDTTHEEEAAAPDTSPVTAVLEEGELAPGGATTVDEGGIGAFTKQAENLTIERRADFEAGLQFFQLPWVVAPGRPEADGLGPTFNADSCLGCHVRNGRGSTSTILLRIGLGPEGAPDPNYGSQLQPRAIAGVAGEGNPLRTETSIEHVLADGTRHTLVAASYAISAPSFGPFGDDLRISPRIAQQLVGQGLLESIPEADLLANEDATDLDGDGISGRAHWVSDGGARRVGRFGWKAIHASVESQTAGAFAEDLGITSPRFPNANCPPAQTACLAAPSGGAPELSAARLAVTASYVRLLGVPARRNGNTSEALRGKALFGVVGCAKCHRPSFITSAVTSEPELAGQRIWPYTDLLLHDLGERLADRRKEGDASEREWRTAPLWGLGLVPIVNGVRALLHDGRARTLEEAILWHGGEADRARLAYEKLTADERALLCAFVESL